MSYVKNADAYSRLVEFCTGLGGTYNPGNQNLKLTAMRALLEKAQSSLHDVSTKTSTYKSVTNEREIAFTGIEKLATRVALALEASGVSWQNVADVRYFSRLIAGRRATNREPILSGDANEQSLKSLIHPPRGYVTVAANFSKLVDRVAMLPKYKASHAELELPALQAKAALLRAKTEAVNKARIALSNAMLKRDRVMYREANSLVDNARLVKRFIRSMYGTRSGPSAQLVGFRFTKPKVR